MKKTIILSATFILFSFVLKAQQLPLYSGHHPEVCSKSRLYWPCVKYNVKSGIFLLMTYQLHGNIMPPETTSFSGILEGMLHPEPIASI